MKALVTGSSGFIGSHMVYLLKENGYEVRGVDINRPVYWDVPTDEFVQRDLSNWNEVQDLAHNIDEIYHFAAAMGGIGYIKDNPASVAMQNIKIDTNMLDLVSENNVNKFFYASSACVYPTDFSELLIYGRGILERDAIPANPEEGYGWEKLFMERLCKYYRNQFEIPITVARFHNIYGPYHEYKDPKAKAPEALCRKVAQAKESDSITIWGDGTQKRSFLYIDDCVRGVFKLIHSDEFGPVNIGSENMVTINELVDIIERVSGKSIKKEYDYMATQGVKVRNSNNGLMYSATDWEPQVFLEEGIERTYSWIRDMVK